jgi:hypothetical protein
LVGFLLLHLPTQGYKGNGFLGIMGTFKETPCLQKRGVLFCTYNIYAPQPTLLMCCNSAFLAFGHLLNAVYLRAMKMKIFTVTLLALALVFAGCRKKGELPDAMKMDAKLLKDTTEVKFTESEFNFGDIPNNDTFVHMFEFTNVGKHEFIIARAVGSCGCTVPEYPKDPIAPGASGKVRVRFDSHGKHGNFTKTVTLTCNTANRQEVLYIKGNVIDADSTATK